MSDSENLELLEPNDRRYVVSIVQKEQYRTLKIMLIVLIMIVLIILIIQLSMIAAVVYIYNSESSVITGKVNSIVDEVQTELTNLDNFTKQVGMFIGWSEKCVKAYGFCK